MTAGTRTLSIEETLLEPSALAPPPVRHALFVVLVALAALLHVTTIGSGDLYSETFRRKCPGRAFTSCPSNCRVGCLDFFDRRAAH